MSSFVPSFIRKPIFKQKNIIKKNTESNTISDTRSNNSSNNISNNNIKKITSPKSILNRKKSKELKDRFQERLDLIFYNSIIIYEFPIKYPLMECDINIGKFVKFIRIDKIFKDEDYYVGMSDNGPKKNIAKSINFQIIYTDFDTTKYKENKYKDEYKYISYFGDIMIKKNNDIKYNKNLYNNDNSNEKTYNKNMIKYNNTSKIKNNFFIYLNRFFDVYNFKSINLFNNNDNIIIHSLQRTNSEKFEYYGNYIFYKTNPNYYEKFSKKSISLSLND